METITLPNGDTLDLRQTREHAQSIIDRMETEGPSPIGGMAICLVACIDILLPVTVVK